MQKPSSDQLAAQSAEANQHVELSIASELLALSRKRQSNAIFRAYHQEHLRILDIEEAALKKKLKTLMELKAKIQEQKHEGKKPKKQKVPPKAG